MKRRSFLVAVIGSVFAGIATGKHPPKMLAVPKERHDGKFASFGEYLAAVKDAGMGYGVDLRLEKLT